MTVESGVEADLDRRVGLEAVGAKQLAGDRRDQHRRPRRVEARIES